jgi:predicted nucleic acid-binding protein
VGLVPDTSVLIDAEPRGQSVEQLVDRLRFALGDAESAISAITVIELTHGIFSARGAGSRERRRVFTEDVFSGLVVHPVSLPIAQLAGQIEGEQAAKGISIAVEDLLIGATALHLGFDVATLNVKHFRLIPGLKTVTL